MKKSILIVSGSFHPVISARSFRTTELAKEFVRQGHDVQVIIPQRSKIHDEFEKEYGVKIKDIGKLFLPNINLGVTGFKRLFKRIVKRGLNLFFEYPNIQLMPLTYKRLKEEKGYDILITVAVPFPIHWGAAFAYKKFNISNVWVADCGDPYMQSEHDTFSKMFYFQYLENLFLKRADYVTVPFEEMKRLFNSDYKEKYKVIPQGVRVQDFKRSSELNQNEVPTFIYSGSIMPGKRDPFEIIEHLETNKIEYRFIFYTRQEYLFEKYKNIVGKRIILKNYIPRKDLIFELSKADFLVNVNTAKSEDNEINAIPSKLMDYTLSSRPIFSYEFGNFDSHVFEKFLAGDYSGKFEVENFDRYRIENVAKKFVDLYETKKS